MGQQTEETAHMTEDNTDKAATPDISPEEPEQSQPAPLTDEEKAQIVKGIEAGDIVPDPLGPVEKGHVRIYIDYEVATMIIKAGEASDPPELSNRVTLYGIVELFKEQKARQAIARDAQHARNAGPGIVPPSAADISRLAGKH
jgi:hypothetical protein